MIKSIIHILFWSLAIVTVSFSQAAHQGVLYVESDCDDNDCISEQQETYIQNALDDLRTNYNLIVNILVYSKDCHVYKVGDNIIGPTLNSNCIWQDNTVDYLIILEPGIIEVRKTAHDFLHVVPGPMGENGLFVDPFQDNLYSAYQIIYDTEHEYNTKFYCIIRKLLDGIKIDEELTGFNIPPDNNNCVLNLSTYYNSYVGKLAIPYHPAAYLDTTPIKDRSLVLRLALNHCTPLAVENAWGIISIYSDEAIEDYVLRQKFGENFLLMRLHPSVEDQSRFSRVQLIPFTDLNQANCFPEFTYLTQPDLDRIEGKINSRSLAKHEIDETLRYGAELIEKYLVSGGERPLGIDNCPGCNTSQALWDPNVFVDCVDIPEFYGDEFETDLSSIDTSASSTDRLLDFAALNPETKQKILDALDRGESRWDLNTQIIFSVHSQSSNISTYSNAENIFSPSPKPGPGKTTTQQKSLTPPYRQVLWIHKDEDNNRICFAVRYNTIAGTVDIPEIEDYQTDAVLTFFKNPPSHFEDSEYGEECGPGENNPWRFGIRYGWEDRVNFWFLVNEMGGLAQELLMTQNISEAAWKPDGDCIFDAPGGVIGVANSIAENNPVGELLGTVSFAYSFATDSNARKGLYELVLNPGQLVEAIYNDIQVIFDPQAPIEDRYYNGGYHAVNLVFMLTGSGIWSELTDQAQHAARKIDDVCKYLPAKQAEAFYQKVRTLGDEAADINEFLKDFDAIPEIEWKKFGENPGMVDAWKDLLNFPVLRKNTGALEAKALPKGSRPNADSYLSSSYISAHLSKFDEGAIRFTTQTNINQYGTLGPNQAFTMPKSEFDDLMIQTGSNLSEVESAIGLDPGSLTNGDAVIAWIKKEDFDGLNIPSGNEIGVNPNWLPGGVTPGGYSEAILDLSNPDLPYLLYPF